MANRQQRRQAERRAKAEAKDPVVIREKQKQEAIAQGWTDLSKFGMQQFRTQQQVVQKTMQKLERNGITADDLKKNYDIGYEAGWKRGQEAATEMFFAAICLALHKLYGFGQERCHRVLTEVYNNVVYTIDSADAVREVFEKTGLTIDLHGDPFDPIEEVKKK